MNHDPRGLPEHVAWMKLRGLRDSTIYHRQCDLRRLTRWLGDEPLNATETDLKTWRASLDKSAGAVYREVSYVQQFYRWALDEELIDSDPSRRLIKPKLPRRLPRPMAEVDLLVAIHNAPPRLRPWLVLAGFEGLRAREIAYLRRDDVHDTSDPAYLHVTALAAKGGRERIVPLSRATLDELQRAGMPRSGWMFTRRDDKPGPVSPGQVSRLCCEYLTEVGAQGTLHSARHRFGTLAYHLSRDIRVTQEVLGHASPGTTAGYAAHSPGVSVDVVAAVGLTLSRPATDLAPRLSPNTRTHLAQPAANDLDRT